MKGFVSRRFGRLRGLFIPLFKKNKSAQSATRAIANWRSKSPRVKKSLRLYKNNRQGLAKTLNFKPDSRAMLEQAKQTKFLPNPNLAFHQSHSLSQMLITRNKNNQNQ